MNDEQLDMVLYHNLNDKRNFYKGSFASDELNNAQLHVRNLNDSACFAFISNTLERTQSNRMGHWLGFIIKITNRKVHLKFIDSFKMPYIFYGKNIKNYIDGFRYLASKKGIAFIFEEVPFRLQASNSKSCGGYTVYAILELKNCKSDNLFKIFSRFDGKNKQKNDKFVENFVVKKWPKSFCSDIFTKNTNVPFCPKKVFGRPGCLKLCSCGKNCCDKVRSIEYIRPNIKSIFS